jgi:cyclic-di-AMP phosphodiesterase PgpH
MSPRAAYPLSSGSSPLRQIVLNRGLALLLIALAAGIMILPAMSVSATVRLTLGASATQDILAPRALRYVSETLTDAARVQAASAVPDVYDPPDVRVARQQVLLLRDILDFMNSVRADNYASWGQKLVDLTSIRDLPLSPDVASVVVNFTATQWTAVQSEALGVLEQTMRGQVRADQLDALRQSTPARVSVDLSEAQVQVVSAVVMPLTVPNSFYNEVATATEREAARAAVSPVSRQFVRGQTVVARGQVVTEVEVEALKAFGLLQPELRWQETASGALAAILVSGLLLIYIQRASPSLNLSAKTLLLLGLLFNMFLLAAKFLVPGHTLLPYLLPAAALAMLVTLLGGVNLAIIVSVALGMLVGYIGDKQLELAIYMAAGGIVAALILGRAQRFDLFFWAGMAGAVAHAAIVLAFWLVSPEMDWIGLAQLLAFSIGNGVLSASLALLGAFVLGNVFDITTSLQLIELSRPDHPLLQFVLRESPGTYQHSLQVSNLAEQAGERIGANTQLIRVGALYHDAGKALRPQYFIENQLPTAANIHTSLDPYTSAGIILGHVHDGLDLARRYHLPSRVRAFIAEHHGTLRTMYQYKRALEAAGHDPARVDESRFAYPGPRPQSKETALLMLADGCEAKTRADRPANEADLDRIVKAVIDDRLSKNQLDDTDLTVHDLQAIRESFVTTLKGMFHSRLQYPEEKPPEISAPQAPPEASPALEAPPAVKAPPAVEAPPAGETSPEVKAPPGG